MDVKSTLKLWAFAAWKVPLVASLRPRVIHLDDEMCRVRVPLSHMSKNHLGSMFFGALWTASDAAHAMLTMKATSSRKVNTIIKTSRCEFYKRVEDDADFICADGKKIDALAQKAFETGERQEAEIEITTVVPKKFGEEPVAKFWLTLSLKKRS
jgi:acyl-coenzyme A thioesterase PaaI-like protein